MKGFVAFLKKLFLAFLIVSALGGGLYSLHYYLSEVAPFRGKNFDQKEWLDALKGESDREYVEKQKECTRCGMLADLEKNYLKKGMPISSVKSLLGSPATSDGVTPIGKYGYEGCIIYELGSDGGVLNDNLLICFDADNKLKEVKLNHDD